MNKLGINSGYIGSDFRNSLSGSFSLEKLYIQRLKGNISPLLGAVVQNGLIFYVNTQNLSSYPGSGTSWNDLSGYNNNLTLVNGVGFQSGNTPSLTFDGASAYASCTNSTASLSTVTNQVTLAILWKPTGTFNIWSGLVGRTVAGSSGIGTWVLQNSNIYAGKIMFAYNARGPSWSSAVTATTTHVAGTWYYSVVTYDGTYVRFYSNSVLTDSTNIGNITFENSGSLEVAHDPPGGDEFLRGSIANIQVYNRALTQLEISQNYNILKTNYI